jgi:Ca2+-binding EF-hand superfamily protein
MSQYLVVINNVQGITEQEADQLKELAFAQDTRFTAAHQSFMIDRNTNALVANWRKMLAETRPEVKKSPSKVQSPRGSTRRFSTLKADLAKSLTKPGEVKVSGDDLIVLRDKVGLGSLDPRSIIAKARSALKSFSKLTFEDFSKFMLGIEGSGEGFNASKKKQALKILYENIDKEGSGEIDKNDALNSVIVLCGGTPDQKSEATFMLYDLNGDGLISFDELLQHQVTVFRILHRVNPTAIDKLGETPETLARATVESIFNEADADGDGVLTLPEFQAWVKGEPIPPEVKEEKRAHVDGSKNKRDLVFQKLKEIRNNLTSTDAIVNIEKMKKDTGLGDIHVDDALSFFQRRNPTGFLTRKIFSEILKDLISEYTDYQPNANVFNNSVNSLFVMFDRDSDGVVDFSELFCGLSTLCAGNAGDKLKAACNSYDESSDGKMQYEEVCKYFESVFSVLLGPEAKSLIDPKRVALVTAKNLFEEYEVELNGEIGFEEIKDWFDKTRVLV